MSLATDAWSSTSITSIPIDSISEHSGSKVNSIEIAEGPADINDDKCGWGEIKINLKGI